MVKNILNILNIRVLRKLKTSLPSIFLLLPRVPQFLHSTTICKSFARNCNTLYASFFVLEFWRFGFRMFPSFSMLLANLSWMKLALLFYKGDLKHGLGRISTSIYPHCIFDSTFLVKYVIIIKSIPKLLFCIEALIFFVHR